MIWRDDDIGANTRIAALEPVDDLFQQYGAEHTIAVIAKGIETRPDLLSFIRERRMVVQLHCWDHDDLTKIETARDDLARAVDTLERYLVRPTVLYPPWNRVNDDVLESAARLGLRVSWLKCSLDQFVRCDGDVAENTVNMHFWHAPDVALLEPALQIVSRQSVE